MHTVHLPYDGNQPVKAYNGFMAAAMGLMFSVDEPSRKFEDWEVKIIDDFFDSLQWTDSATEPLVKEVPYGKLMMFVDMQNRWTYKGSVTTPPCATAVYWNVLTTIYPVKQKHLDQFKLQLAKNKKQVPPLKKTGNWRVITDYVEGPNGSQG
jgi:carbonic anhydrase